MRHEKILKRYDGTRVRLTVEVRVEWNSDVPVWSLRVAVCDKGKRTFVNVVNDDDYKRRKLSYEEKKAYDEACCLAYVTHDEVDVAYEELWIKLKPEKIAQ